MTPSEFRSLALSFPEAVESAHMGHPDFRVRKKIFATLGPGETWGMVKLTVEQQAEFVGRAPEVFEPVKGGWGVRGATVVKLEAAREFVVHAALSAAFCNVAPKRLVREVEGELG